jgi:putative sugar O-methyltransferase
MTTSHDFTTSISDCNSYREVCARAASDDNFFKCFKSDKNYQEILEHTSPELGACYFMSVLYQTPQFLDDIDTFRKNDLLGGAKLHQFGAPIGLFSPSTLRYVKVLSDLTFSFGPLDNLHLVEIGGGYGGQCLITHLKYNVASYTIIDIPPALKLQERYLAQHRISGVRFLSLEELEGSLSSDLFISNYAITECKKSIADVYLDNVARHAKRGYITGNVLSSDCYTREEMERALPQGVVVGEYPPTKEGNYILLWK